MLGLQIDALEGAHYRQGRTARNDWQMSVDSAAARQVEGRLMYSTGV
jgi:hypothetical protein